MNTKHKKIINIFTLEFFLSFFSTFILMIITYISTGGSGILKLINGYGDQFKTPNILNLIILFIIGLVSWFFFYFFNLKHKILLKKLSLGLFDICINLLRLACGIMISFVFLHLLVDGYNHKLLNFTFFGLLALIEVVVFSYFKDYLLFKNTKI